MKLLKSIMSLLFTLFTIGLVIFVVAISFNMLWNEYSEYTILKEECNQDLNKDICFCYDGSCEIKYECSNEECKDYENRLCEIATKAHSKDWEWRYCNSK